ncbi:MerR family transcriptional regulator [Candidatus Omnitrophota bacterium]
MHVASMLAGLHPQTLRKYERAGLLTPSRSKTLRMYSDEDITRLKIIKHMVDETGLNLAGVELSLKLQARILDMKKELTSAGTSQRLTERLEKSLDEILKTLGTR